MSHSEGLKEAKNQLKDAVSREEGHERGAVPKELSVGQEGPWCRGRGWP